jgi:hypothetical protein
MLRGFPVSRRRLLVRAAGAHAHRSWITGLVTGMAESGVDVRDADVLIGTWWRRWSTPLRAVSSMPSVGRGACGRLV